MSKKDKIQPRILSGFMELLPEDQMAFNGLMDKIRSSFELYGFTPLDTPAVELVDILFAKAGGQIDKEIYKIANRGDDVALRFDLTVPLARYVAQNYGQLSFPFRRYQIGKVWRAERAQKGRFREFYQCDIDVIGSTAPAADAEMVAAINQVFSTLGFEKFTIRINNRKLLLGLLGSLKLEDKSSQVMRAIDKLEKIGQEKVRSELRAAKLTPSQINKIIQFTEIAGKNDEVLTQLRQLKINNSTFVTGLEELEAVLDTVRDFGVPAERYKIDLAIARGLDYYTGTVYETVLDDYPQIGSVCSGGRYDDLAGYYTDQTLPGVGISIGLSRLFYQLKEAGLIKSAAATAAEILVVKTDEKFLSYSLQVAAKLRGAGIKTLVYIENAKLAKQLKFADKLGVKKVVVIGEKEVATGKITLRDMASGEQKICTTAAVVKELK